MGGRMSREKGKRGERELVNLLRQLVDGKAEQVAKRNWGAQSEREGSGIDVESANVVGFKLAWQVKYGRRTDNHTALKEVVDTPEGLDGAIPLAATRRVPAKDNEESGWLVSLRLQDFLTLLRQAEGKPA